MDYTYMEECCRKSVDESLRLEDRLRADFEQRFLTMVEAKALNKNRVIFFKEQDTAYTHAQTLFYTGVLSREEFCKVRDAIYMR